MFFLKDSCHRVNISCSILFFLLAMTCILCEAFQDDYLNDARASCYKTQDTYSCFKFRSLRYIATMVGDDTWTAKNYTEDDSFTNKPIKLVRMKEFAKWGAKPETNTFFEETRQLQEDSELEKFVKFGKRQIELFLKSYGLSVGLPDGAVAIPQDYVPSANDAGRSSELGTEARGKKKKLAILLPLLSLFALFKLKLLLVPILLTVLFVKKILVLAALFLPTILSTLKVCKVPQVPAHNQWSAGEVASDYANYGGYAAYGGANGAHSKDWGASRAYGAYKDLYNNKQENYKTLNDVASSYGVPSNPNILYPNSGVVSI